MAIRTKVKITDTDRGLSKILSHRMSRSAPSVWVGRGVGEEHRGLDGGARHGPRARDRNDPRSPSAPKASTATSSQTERQLGEAPAAGSGRARSSRRGMDKLARETEQAAQSISRAVRTLTLPLAAQTERAKGNPCPLTETGALVDSLKVKVEGRCRLQIPF